MLSLLPFLSVLYVHECAASAVDFNIDFIQKLFSAYVCVRARVFRLTAKAACDFRVLFLHSGEILPSKDVAPHTNTRAAYNTHARVAQEYACSILELLYFD